MSETLLPLLFLVGLIGGLAYAVHTIHRRALASARRACMGAARALSLRSEPLDRPRAAEVFGLAHEKVLSDVLAFRGSVGGVSVVIGTFRHESNTTFNGAPIPIVSTHVAATIERPLPGNVLLQRRVFGMPDSVVKVDASVESKLVVQAEAPAELAPFLEPRVELQLAISAFLDKERGLASVESTVVRTIVAHGDPARIEGAVKRTTQLAHELSAASGGQAYRDPGVPT